MKRAGIVGVAALIVAVVAYFAFFHPSDEDRIKDAIARLAKVVSVHDGDTLIGRAGRIRPAFNELLDPSTHATVAELGSRTGRKELGDLATAGGMRFAQATVEVERLDIRLDEARVSGRADGTAILTATVGGEKKRDSRPVHFLLRKDGSNWVITTIDVGGPPAD